MVNVEHAALLDAYDLAPPLELFTLPDSGSDNTTLGALRAFVEGQYRALPRQMIHGDFGPVNTLFHAGRLAAILDFESAGPDVRALDVAAGLEFSMRVWEYVEPWEAARAFCRGYTRRVRLTDREIEALPGLIRPRDAVSVVWRAGQAVGDGRPALEGIERMCVVARWLEAHGPRLMDIAAQEVAERYESTR
jgi:homoserine kinase type II